MTLGTKAPERKGALRANTLALLAMQFFNYVFPLLLTPFLARSLGPLAFGEVGYCLALLSALLVVVDYGFSMSAPLRIARAESVRVSNSAVTRMMAIKLAITAIAIAGLVAHAVLAGDALIVLVALPLVGLALQPAWYFQGRERMWAITRQTVLTKAVYLVGVLAFVRGSDDAKIVLVAYGLAAALGAALAVRTMYSIGFTPAWRGGPSIRELLVESAGFFASRIALAAYMSGAVLFLGTVAAPFQVACFVVCQQLYLAGQSLVGAVVMALYPHMARTRDFRLVWRWVRVALLLGVLAVSASGVAGGWVLGLVFGETYAESGHVLTAFALAFALASVSALIGFPVFAAMGREALANRAVFLGGGVQVAAWFILAGTDHVSAFTVAASVVACEGAVLAVRLWMLWSLREELS